MSLSAACRAQPRNPVHWCSSSLICFTLFIMSLTITGFIVMNLHIVKGTWHMNASVFHTLYFTSKPGMIYQDPQYCILLRERESDCSKNRPCLYWGCLSLFMTKDALCPTCMTNLISHTWLAHCQLSQLHGHVSPMCYFNTVHKGQANTQDQFFSKIK